MVPPPPVPSAPGSPRGSLFALAGVLFLLLSSLAAPAGVGLGGSIASAPRALERATPGTIQLPALGSHPARVPSRPHGGTGPGTGGSSNPTWVNLSADGTLGTTSPSSRSQESEAYVYCTMCASTDIVLFGGCHTASVPCATGTLGDTWLFDGTSWSSTFSSGPRGRADASMAWDPSTNTTVLFGGLNATKTTTTILNDTWSLRLPSPSSPSWTNQTSTVGPAPRFGAEMSYDPNAADCGIGTGTTYTGCIILVGGCSSLTAGLCVHDDKDTWAYYPNNATWRNETAWIGFPSNPGFGGGLAQDPANGHVVLFGGENVNGGVTSALGLTDALYSGAWHDNIATSGSPSARVWPSLSEDSVDGYILLFGGCAGQTCSSANAETWGFTGTTWTQGSPPAPPSARGAASFVYDPFQSKGILFGGCASPGCPDNDTYAWEIPSPFTVPGPTLSHSPVDVTVPVMFSESISGGVPPYSCYWTIGSTFHSSSLWFSYTFTTPGSYAIMFQANDSDSDVRWGNTTEMVYPYPTVGAKGAPRDTSTGTTIAFTGYRSGGAPLFTYQWRFGDGTYPMLPSQNTSHAYTTAGTFYARFWANDSSGVSVTALTQENITGPLKAMASSDRLTTDVGATIDFYGNATGGFPAYTFQWWFADAHGANGQNSSHKWTRTGLYTVTFWVNDSRSDSDNATINITVVAAPLVTISYAAPSPADANNPVVFRATVVGGASPRWLNWTFANGYTGKGSPVTQTFTQAGQYIVRVWCNDSVGGSNESSYVLTVNAPFTGSASATPTGADVGVVVAFTGSVSGGTAPYGFVWRFDDGSLPSRAQDPSHAFNATGTYTVAYWVNDSANGSVAATVPITVSADLTLTATLIPSEGIAPLKVVATAKASGGTGTPQYRWQFGDGGSSGSGTTLYTYENPGTYTAVVYATDTGGGNVSQSFPVIVGAPLTARVDLSQNGTHPGTPVVVTAATNGGGIGSLSYLWSVNGTPKAYTSPTFTYTPSGPGDFTFQVAITDQLPETIIAGTVLVVNPNGTALPGLKVSAALTPSVAQNGSTVSASATPTGGSGTITYVWLLNGTVALGTGQTIAFLAPAHGGMYAVNVTATDALGERAYAQPTLSVFWSGTPPPPALQVSGVSTNTTSLFVGGLVSFSVIVSGGVTPYTYVWSLNGSAASSWENTTYTEAEPSIAFPHAGTYEVRVWVSDAHGDLALGALVGSITVKPITSKGSTPPGNTTNSGAPLLGGLGAYALVALVVLAVVALLLVLFLRRRRSSALATDKQSPPVGGEEGLFSADLAATDSDAVDVPPVVSASPGPRPPTRPTASAAAWSEEPEVPTGSDHGWEETAPTSAAVAPSALPPVLAPGASGAETAPTQRPKGPAWPMLPMTVVETTDPHAFWEMVGASGLERSKILVFALEAPGGIGATYGLTGATIWRISRTEGEENVAPGDVDKMGYILESFLQKGNGRAVVFRGIERVVDAAGIRNASRLVEVAREVAESTRGAVLVHINPDKLEVSERRQFEEGAKLIKLAGTPT